MFLCNMDLAVKDPRYALYQGEKKIAIRDLV